MLIFDLTQNILVKLLKVQTPRKKEHLFLLKGHLTTGFFLVNDSGPINCYCPYLPLPAPWTMSSSKYYLRMNK